MDGEILLYNPHAAGDGSHHAAAPGAYESWQFDAESEDGNFRLIVTFIDGDIFDPRYARRYRAYLRRPTRRKPPMPSGHSAMHAAIYERDKTLLSFTVAGPLTASQEKLNISIAGCGALRHENGDVQVGIKSERPEFNGELTLRPAFARRQIEDERIFPTENASQFPANNAGILPVKDERILPVTNPAGSHTNGAQTHSHHKTDLPKWIIAGPLCTASANLRVGHRPIRFSGRGYWEHRLSLKPLWGSPNIIRGRVLESNCALFFESVQATDRSTRGVVTHVVKACAGELCPGEAEMFAAEGKRWTWAAQGYPAVIRVEGLVFDAPRVMDRAPGRLRVVYRNRTGGGTPLLCEIIYPSRVGRID